MMQQRGLKSLRRGLFAAGLGAGLVLAIGPALADDFSDLWQLHPHFSSGSGNASAEIGAIPQSVDEIQNNHRNPPDDAAGEQDDKTGEQADRSRHGDFDGDRLRGSRFRGDRRGGFQSGFGPGGFNRRGGQRNQGPPYIAHRINR